MIFNYTKIFLGFLLIIFDFNLNYNSIIINLIPDFIGYFMIASFFKYMPSEDYNKKLPIFFAYTLGIYNILMMFLPPLSGNSTLVSLNLVLNTIICSINLGLNYFICKVIIEESRKYRKTSLLNFGFRTWYIVATYSISFMIVSPFFINYSLQMPILSICLFVLGFLELILLLILVYKAKITLPASGTVIE